MRTLALVLTLPLALAACTSDEAPVEPDAVPAQSSMDAGRVSADAEAGSGDHMQNPPHGGVIAEAGEGHLELVRRGKTVQIYPLDDMAQPMSADGITGATAVLHPHDGADQTLPLTLMGDHLMATVPNGVTDYSLDVTVPMASGERREGHFDAAGHDETGHDDGDGHTH